MQLTKKMQPSEKSALNEWKLSLDSLGSKSAPVTTIDGTSALELRFTCSDKKSSVPVRTNPFSEGSATVPASLDKALCP